MKKWIYLISIISLFLTIGACKKQTNNPAVKPYYNWTVDAGQWDATIGEYRPEANSSLKLWVDDATWAEALISEYNKYFPEVPVTYEIVGAVDTRAKMELDGPAGLGADVFVMPHDHIGQALASNVIGPVGDYSTNLQAKIIPTSIQTVTAKDANGVNQIYAFPISGESDALFYNKDLLTSKGVSLATTWEEIITQSGQFTDINNNFYWVGMDAGNAYDMMFNATAHGYDLFGPTHDNPDLVNFNSTAMIDALTWHRNFRLQALNVDAGSITGDNIKSLFESGSMAYIIDGPWDVARYKTAGINFGVVKIPTINVNGTDVQPYTFAGNQLAAVSTFSKYPAAARTLANFMAMGHGAQVMYNITGKLPTLIDTSAITGLANDPYLKGIIDQLQFSIPMPTITEMGYFWSYSGTMFSNAWNAPDGMTPAQAAVKAQADYDAARSLNQ